ncbi:MAG TPA: hypothetical protein VK204_05085 [Nocardioidaceae bacterium]|nr:hypothetical protein [Nocardioidaceae bacterium]
MSGLTNLVSRFTRGGSTPASRTRGRRPTAKRGKGGMTRGRKNAGGLGGAARRLMHRAH